MGLWSYQTTPIHNGFSLAELLMGRQLRTNMPVLPSKLLPAVPNSDIIRQKELLYKDRMKTSFDRRHGTLNFPSLDIGDHVYVPDTAKSAVIVDGAGPRSYNIQTPDGGVIRRNRRALNATDLPQQEPSKPGSQARFLRARFACQCQFVIRFPNRTEMLVCHLVIPCFLLLPFLEGQPVNVVLHPDLCQTNLEREILCCVFIFPFRCYIFYFTIFYLGCNNNVVIGKHLDR